MSSTLPKPVTNVVWGLFNGRCAMCDIELSKTTENGKTATIGKIAHIVGEKKGSARFDNPLPLEKRNLPDNLMLLCGTHHDTVDNYDSEYSDEELHIIRVAFLQKLELVFQQQILDISYSELEVTIAYLVGASVIKDEGNLLIITPSEKIRKNELTSNVETLLRMGLIQQNELEGYLNRNPDLSFASRLRNIIVTKYNELKEGGVESNEIFFEMLEFASTYSIDIKRRAAGIVIVAYYFNMCDIFEK